MFTDIVVVSVTTVPAITLALRILSSVGVAPKTWWCRVIPSLCR